MDTSIPITIVIPVGPRPSHSRWLAEALESVMAQEYPPDEVILVDDMAALSHWTLFNGEPSITLPPNYRIIHNDWLMGVAHSFNIGVVRARNHCVLMMGSDDVLHPTALAELSQAYAQASDPQGYYWLDVQYMSDGMQQSLPCHAAMVTKGLWELTGGFPPESAVGQPDTILISMMLAQMPEHLHHVTTPEPVYFYRDHPEAETAISQPYAPAAGIVRDVFTVNWRRPEWTRR